MGKFPRHVSDREERGQPGALNPGWSEDRKEKEGLDEDCSDALRHAAVIAPEERMDRRSACLPLAVTKKASAERITPASHNRKGARKSCVRLAQSQTSI